jgi:U3 small nucleolar RNA-associated protein 15
VVTGGLDGHVKVFETTGWNVMSSLKYPSPILAVSVIGASETAAVNDRHLLVGMASGLLSIRTRLSNTEAAKMKEREKEMAALVAGTADELEAKKEKRKRRVSARKRLDLVGEGEHVVIANEPRSKGRKREQDWQYDLRHGRYAKALDRVLDDKSPHYAPLNVLTLLMALRHRSAMRAALQGRDETTIQPIIKWICSHIIDPRYISLCVEAGIIILELYVEYAGVSKDLHTQFGTLYRRVKAEVESAQMALQTCGMLDSLMMGAV